VYDADGNRKWDQNAREWAPSTGISQPPGLRQQSLGPSGRKSARGLRRRLGQVLWQHPLRPQYHTARLRIQSGKEWVGVRTDRQLSRIRDGKVIWNTSYAFEPVSTPNSRRYTSMPSAATTAQQAFKSYPIPPDTDAARSRGRPLRDQKGRRCRQKDFQREYVASPLFVAACCIAHPGGRIVVTKRPPAAGSIARCFDKPARILGLGRRMPQAHVGQDYTDGTRGAMTSSREWEYKRGR